MNNFSLPFAVTVRRTVRCNMLTIDAIVIKNFARNCKLSTIATHPFQQPFRGWKHCSKPFEVAQRLSSSLLFGSLNLPALLSSGQKAPVLNSAMSSSRIRKSRAKQPLVHKHLPFEMDVHGGQVTNDLGDHHASTQQTSTSCEDINLELPCPRGLDHVLPTTKPTTNRHHGSFDPANVSCSEIRSAIFSGAACFAFSTGPDAIGPKHRLLTVIL